MQVPIPVPPILSSKKFLASALSSLLAYLGMQRGMSTEEVATIVAPLLAFVGMQGIADIGKERAKVEAQSLRDGVSVNLHGKVNPSGPSGNPKDSNE